MGVEFLENPLFNITFFGGIVFSLARSVQLKFPPKKINSLYGYRSVSSMKSQETWDFAQKISAKELIKLGFLLSVVSFVAIVTNFNNSVNLIIGLFLMILLVIILLVRVEWAIKAKFKN